MIEVVTYLAVAWRLIGVAHNLRRLNREVGDILMLLTITHVYLAPLSLPEVGESTGPDG